jgi:hypothetical protein
MLVLKSAQDASRYQCRECCDLQFVDFTSSPTSHLWEDEPSNNHGDSTCTRKAVAQNRLSDFAFSCILDNGLKLHSQEACLDTPFCNSPIDHKWRTEAEHNANEVRRGEGPSRSSRAQALLGNLGRVGIADCRSASGRECS